MIEYDELENKMVLKLVYYRPALSGKTTNLLKLHDLFNKEGRGDVMVLDTKDDRTIFFDLLPFFIIASSGLKIKLIDHEINNPMGYVTSDLNTLKTYMSHGREVLQSRTEGLEVVITTMPLDDHIIHIADNGPEIPNTIINRILEPFFTTREVGRGWALPWLMTSSCPMVGPSRYRGETERPWR